MSDSRAHADPVVLPAAGRLGPAMSHRRLDVIDSAADSNTGRGAGPVVVSDAVAGEFGQSVPRDF